MTESNSITKQDEKERRLLDFFKDAGGKENSEGLYTRSQFILARHGQGMHNPEINKGIKKHGHLLKVNYLAFIERMTHDSALLDPALTDALLTPEGVR